MLSSLFKTLDFIIEHPLNRHQRFSALMRFFRWQASSRIIDGPIVIPFVNGTRLLASRGMTGATGNVYCGLHEFEDMGFVLHVLRKDDVFLDVGANIGSYSILAASTGAQVIAFEPVPSTHEKLLDNINLNRFGAQITAWNKGVGASNEVLHFTSDQDTVNHVATGKESDYSIKVPVIPLDSLTLPENTAIVLKVDVEGFESFVLAGARHLLTGHKVLAVLLELNGSGERYGCSDRVLYDTMASLGFSAYRYDPFSRSLTEVEFSDRMGNNLLFSFDIEKIAERCQNAACFQVNSITL